MNTPKPVSAVALALSGIPTRLKKLDRWILWKYTQLPNGKWTKTPHSPSSGHKIDATNLKNGVSFTVAVQALRKNKTKFDGIGFLLGDGIAGIDVDDCRDADGKLDARGQELSAKLIGTFAEISPSGSGFKALVDISDDPSLAHVGKTSETLEIYGGKRYFCITGNLLPGHARTVASLPGVFKAIAESVGATRESAAGDDRPPASDKKGTLGIDLKVARELLDHLPFKWCDEYGDWLRGGMALHHEFGGSMQALVLWDEYSKRSSKYDDGGCGAKWMTFGKPGKEVVTVRTLVREAQATGWRAPSTIASAIADFGDWLDDASVRRFDLDNVPKMDWMFGGIAPYGKVLILAGAGGSSKSFLALALAAHWAARKAFAVFEPRCGPDDEALVLFAEEDEDDLHRRFAATAKAGGFTDAEMKSVRDHLMVRSMLELEDVTLAKYDPTNGDVVGGALYDMLRSALQSRPTIRWIVADPLALLHQLQENDNGGMAKLLRLLGRLAREFKVAIWLVHHLSKSGAQADDLNTQAIRGASAIVDNARAALMVKRLTAADSNLIGGSDEEARRTVRVSFGKNSHGDTLNECYVRIRDDGSVEPIAVQPMPVPPGVAKVMRAQAMREQAKDYTDAAALRAILMLLQRGSLSKRAIHRAKPANRSKAIIDPVLESAIGDGLITIAVGPNGANLHAITGAGRAYLDGDTA
jgi:RecA-family ATPase